MCVFFEKIKENCGVLSPHWMMSDLASQFYNAWKAIMGVSPVQLFCTWHVDRAWQKELKVKVKDTIIAAEIYKMLRIVLQQTDVASCQKIPSNPQCNLEFSEYFEQQWCNNLKSWAYCYRGGKTQTWL